MVSQSQTQTTTIDFHEPRSRGIEVNCLMHVTSVAPMLLAHTWWLRCRYTKAVQHIFFGSGRQALSLILINIACKIVTLLHHSQEAKEFEEARKKGSSIIQILAAHIPQLR